MSQSSEVTQDGISLLVPSDLFFFILFLHFLIFHHSSTKNNSCYSHDDKKKLKKTSIKIELFQMTGSFNVTASLDSDLEMQENTHLKANMQKPSPGFSLCFANQLTKISFFLLVLI